jgi:hypothetical protein
LGCRCGSGVKWWEIKRKLKDPRATFQRKFARSAFVRPFATTRNFLKSSNVKRPGTDVMITIFGEKMAFFSKTNVMITFFCKITFYFSQKRRIFRQIFLRIKKNHNIGPRFSKTLRMITLKCFQLLLFYFNYYNSPIVLITFLIYIHLGIETL